MTSREEHDDRSGLTTAALWLVILAVAYLFSTGPVTRWAPRTADKIFRPLTPVVQNHAWGKPLRAWLRVWGVNVP